MDSLRNLGFHSLNEVLALENFPTVLPTELKKHSCDRTFFTYERK